MVTAAVILALLLADALPRAGAYTHGGFALIEEGTCLDRIGWGYVEDPDLCVVAAKALVMEGVLTGTGEYPNYQGGQWWASNRPPGCHAKTDKSGPLFNTHHNTENPCSAKYPCICEKWGTEPLPQGEVFKPRTNFELRLAVASCIVPVPKAGKNYCEHGWSKRAFDAKRVGFGCGLAPTYTEANPQRDADGSPKGGCGDTKYAASLRDMIMCKDADRYNLPDNTWYYSTFPQFGQNQAMLEKNIEMGGKFLLWESTGANCPAAFGPIGTWDTSLITNTQQRKFSLDSLFLFSLPKETFSSGCRWLTLVSPFFFFLFLRFFNLVVLPLLYSV